MRFYETIKRNVHFVLVVTAFIVAGSAASQLCATTTTDEEAQVKAKKRAVKKKKAQKKSAQNKAVKKSDKKRQVKSTKNTSRKKTPKATTKRGKKVAKQPKKSVARRKKVDKVVVAPSALEVIKNDPNQGKWEKASESDESLDMDNIAVGPKNELYGVDKETKAFYVHDGKVWVKKHDDIKYVTVAMDGSVLLLGGDGGVFLYKNDDVTRIAESNYKFDSLAAFNVNDIFAIENDHNLPYGKLYRYQKGVWSLVGKGVCDVFTTAGSVWVTGFDDTAWRCEAK